MNMDHNHVSFRKFKETTTFVRMSLVTVIASSNMLLNFIMYLLHVFNEVIWFNTRARFKRHWDKINRQAQSNTYDCLKWGDAYGFGFGRGLWD